jgi:nicotinate-nucleotide adenylyltransferase
MQQRGVTELPNFARGMRIGLFGGSFNPAHEGHRLVALQCLRRLNLHAIWMLVSPGNPLKDHSELAPLAERVERTRALMAHPQIRVTGFEAARGFTYTYDTLNFLVSACAGVNFVWIMGADSLESFDRWERWRDIAALMPLAVYARPGRTLTAPRSKAARVLAPFRIPEEQAESLAGRPPPAWVYLRGLMSGQSSTALRAAGRAPGQAPAGPSLAEPQDKH